MECNEILLDNEFHRKMQFVLVMQLRPLTAYETVLSIIPYSNAACLARGRLCLFM